MQQKLYVCYILQADKGTYMYFSEKNSIQNAEHLLRNSLSGENDL